MCSAIFDPDGDLMRLSSVRGRLIAAVSGALLLCRLTNTASITADQADPDIGDNRVQ